MVSFDKIVGIDLDAPAPAKRTAPDSPNLCSLCQKRAPYGSGRLCWQCRPDTIGSQWAPTEMPTTIEDDPHDAAEHAATIEEVARALRGVATCDQRIEHAQSLMAHARKQIADAERRIAQAQEARGDLLASLSADAREELEDRGGAYIDAQLWAWIGSTDAGVPILRRIQPMVVGE